uniref:Uncharacterized protein n=1 Tax=Tanacetum cinerariifolium TaxID=118510 RepID=A0A6L2NVQ3_TANCI|nr:hypothetical protein [Tanacetum cinerariifolium]
MSRANPQATIIFEEQLVTCANRHVIKKNNQCGALDSDITDFMLRFVVEILKQHKLYKLISPPDPNNTYIKSPSENQILRFIKTLRYDEDPDTKMIVVSKMVATRLHQPWRAILSVLNRNLTEKDSNGDTVVDPYSGTSSEMDQQNPTLAKIPILDTATGSTSERTATKKGRTVALTTEDMQKRKNDVKARTTLLLALPDEHQL